MNGNSTTANDFRSEAGWSRAQAMTDEEAEANALADPDNQPLTEERMASMERVPRVKVIRRALKLTREEFARRYAIPLDIVRDWEEGKAMPDRTASAYLRVIAREPEMTARALQPPRAA